MKTEGGHGYGYRTPASLRKGEIYKQDATMGSFASFWEQRQLRSNLPVSSSVWKMSQGRICVRRVDFFLPEGGARGESARVFGYNQNLHISSPEWRTSGV